MQRIKINTKLHCDTCNRRIKDEIGERFICCSCCGKITCFNCERTRMKEVLCETKKKKKTTSEIMKGDYRSEIIDGMMNKLWAVKTDEDLIEFLKLNNTILRDWLKKIKEGGS